IARREDVSARQHSRDRNRREHELVRVSALRKTERALRVRRRAAARDRARAAPARAGSAVSQSDGRRRSRPAHRCLRRAIVRRQGHLLHRRACAKPDRKARRHVTAIPQEKLDTARPPDSPAAALPLEAHEGLAPVAVGATAVARLVSDPLPRTIARVAVPAVASTLLMTIFGTVDAFWVGTKIGAVGIAAVATSMFWIWLVISIAEMVGIGLTAVAAR